jgi:hypothetical protein
MLAHLANMTNARPLKCSGRPLKCSRAGWSEEGWGEGRTVVVVLVAVVVGWSGVR